MSKSALDSAPFSFYAIIILWFSLMFLVLKGISFGDFNDKIIGIIFTVLNIILFYKLDSDLERNGTKG